MSSNYSPLAMKILRKRYLKEGEEPEDMFRRVSSWVAQAEKKTCLWEERFFKLLNGHYFIPNSPCLMNAGTVLPQLAACYVYPVEDNLEKIFSTLKDTAVTHKSGGGTGFSFSNLRPRGDSVGMTGGVTSGPVSFMEVYDKATEAVKQGGKRRGANMGVLRVDHPDILEFIEAKHNEEKLNNFNISVALTDEFMRAVMRDDKFPLCFPPCKERKKVSARKIFDRIAAGGWRNGEPGVLFIDKINRNNPLKKIGEIESTNPCAEQPLLPYEACILGSVNLEKHAGEDGINFKKLSETVRCAVRFLDDAIDMSDYPLKKVRETVKKNRKIGLGVMGFSSMLMKLEVPYSSVEGVKTAGKVMKFINETAHEASRMLAEEKGEFPNFYRSELKKKRRNALLTTIAPTGTISLIAGTTSGIEPVYSLVWERKDEEGKKHRFTDPVFKEKIRKYAIDEERAVEEVIQKGGIDSAVSIPERLKPVFLNATEINPRIHLLIQAAFQRHVDNAISKTVNLPREFTIKEVKDIILRAYRLGCKGVTVYRQQSRRQQVFNMACACEENTEKGDYYGKE